MIIDAQSHAFHGKFLEQIIAAGGNWAKEELETDLKVAKVKPQYMDVDLRIAQMDKHGIDMQVVTTGHRLDVSRFPGDAAAKLSLAKALNENMVRLMEDSRGRLLAMGVIPLESFEQGGRQEVERAIKTLGLKGINLTSNINGKPLDLPEFEPFWALAAEMDFPVYFHPQGPIGNTDRPYEAEYDMVHNFGWPYETTLMLSRLVFSGIMERYPTLKIVSHHLGGGMIPFFWGRINETYHPSNQGILPQVIKPVMTKPPIEYFSLFYYDTAVGGSAPAIRCAYEVFGADRMVFATDAPYGPGTGEDRLANYPDVIRSLGLSEAENRKIFADNALEMLGMVK